MTDTAIYRVLGQNLQRDPLDKVQVDSSFNGKAIATRVDNTIQLFLSNGSISLHTVEEEHDIALVGERFLDIGGFFGWQEVVLSSLREPSHCTPAAYVFSELDPWGQDAFVYSPITMGRYVVEVLENMDRLPQIFLFGRGDVNQAVDVQYLALSTSAVAGLIHCEKGGMPRLIVQDRNSRQTLIDYDFAPFLGENTSGQLRLLGNRACWDFGELWAPRRTIVTISPSDHPDQPVITSDLGWMVGCDSSVVSFTQSPDTELDLIPYELLTTSGCVSLKLPKFDAIAYHEGTNRFAISNTQTGEVTIWDPHTKQKTGSCTIDPRVGETDCLVFTDRGDLFALLDTGQIAAIWFPTGAAALPADDPEDRPL